MITRIEALNYRSLRYVSQRVSRFQTLVGPNGSGKSSFLDVVSFLGDLLRVGPFAAILGDGKDVPRRAADPAHLCWMREGHSFELAIEMQVPEERLASPPNGKQRLARYEVRVEIGTNGSETRFAIENFWLLSSSAARPDCSREYFPQLAPIPSSIVKEPGKHAPAGWKKVVSKNPESGIDYFKAETSGWQTPFRLGPTKSALANLPEDEEKFPVATWAKHLLIDGVRKVVLNADAMRRPSPPGSPKQFLPDGSNLPWVVDALRESTPERFKKWISHLQTTIPDLKDVSTVERPEDRNKYIVVSFSNGLSAPSWVVSDGTLRLLALTLLAYIPDLNGIYLIEEPENGIHPRAAEAVYQSLSSVYSAQVLCASHSPVILGLATSADLLCFAKDGSGATDIVRGDKHPQLRNWQGTLDLGKLHAAGVLG